MSFRMSHFILCYDQLNLLRLVLLAGKCPNWTEKLLTEVNVSTQTHKPVHQQEAKSPDLAIFGTFKAA